MPHPKFSMRNFSPNPTNIPNIIKVGHTVPEICSGQKITDGGWQTADGARRSDIWITKSLPELSSGETKKKKKNEICHIKLMQIITTFDPKWVNPYQLNRPLHVDPLRFG